MYQIPHLVMFFHSSFKSTRKYKMRSDYNYTISPPTSPISFSTHTLSTFIYSVVLGNSIQSLCPYILRSWTIHWNNKNLSANTSSNNMIISLPHLSLVRRENYRSSVPGFRLLQSCAGNQGYGEFMIVITCNGQKIMVCRHKKLKTILK